SIFTVTSSPTVSRACCRARRRMSPVPHATSRTRSSLVSAASAMSRSFQRRSSPYESTTVMRSYRSAIVANNRRTYRRLPIGVEISERRLMCSKERSERVERLLSADEQNRNLDEMADAVDGGAAQKIVEKAMPV